MSRFSFALNKSLDHRRAVLVDGLPRYLMWWGSIWLLSLVLGSQWLVDLGLSLNAHGHSSLYAHGHPFVDARSWWGIPNTLDVLSNLPFGVIGFWGWFRIDRDMPVGCPARKPAMLAFVGLVLTCLGSSVYHGYPLAETLVLDRMGMALTFAGVLGWTVAERWQTDGAHRVAWGVVVVGLISASLPCLSANVLPWVVLQFGGLLCVCMHAVWASRALRLGDKFRSPWFGVVGFYVVAKLFESWDAEIYSWTQQVVAGHTLKHLVAACALIPLLGTGKDCGTMRLDHVSRKDTVVSE